MFIRRLGPRDAALFREIRLEALLNHPTAFASDYADQAKLPLDSFAHRLDDNAVFGGFASGNEDKLLGTVGVSRDPSPKMRHNASIFAVYVRPEARGTGLARALIEAAIAEAATDCRTVRLLVEAGNIAAQKLYAATGFTVWARDEGLVQIDGQFYDMLVMRRDLP